MQLPCMAINRIKLKTRNPTSMKNKNNQNKPELTPSRDLTSLFLTIEGSVKVSRKHAVTMGAGVFQGRYNHQKPPDGSQGPRSYEG